MDLVIEYNEKIKAYLFWSTEVREGANNDAEMRLIVSAAWRLSQEEGH